MTVRTTFLSLLLVVGCADGTLKVEEGYLVGPDGGPATGDRRGNEGANCDLNSECSGGLVCVPQAQGPGQCLALCTTNLDCPSGQCRVAAGTSSGFCELPQGGIVDGAFADGAACTTDAECAGGSCLTEAQGFPGGHCSTLGCAAFADCAGDNTGCLEGTPNYCIALCAQDGDCRAGYECRAVGGGAYCAPKGGNTGPGPNPQDNPGGDPQDTPRDDPDPEPEPEPEPEPQTTLGEVVCSSRLTQENAYQGFDEHAFEFDIPSGTTSFMVVPFSTSSRQQLYSVDVAGPGGRLDMFGDYDFANANPSFLIDINPTLVPQAPQFANFVAAGRHSMRMAANADVCHIVYAKSGPGTTIDLNFHFVGVPGLSASNARSHGNFQSALQRVGDVYQPAGLRLGQIRYSDTSSNVTTRYSTVRSEEDVFSLVENSRDPGATLDDRLSINVFFIDQFAIQGGQVLGISAGLPGAAGVHGTRSSGLVFSASTMNDPGQLGQVLAHEIGHYLGLFHTSEQQGQAFDPLSDTQECASWLWSDPGSCPDLNNLMFPFAGVQHARVSNQQGQVVHYNPLVK
jgi:hypothetical protein